MCFMCVCWPAVPRLDVCASVLCSWVHPACLNVCVHFLKKNFYASRKLDVPFLFPSPRQEEHLRNLQLNPDCCTSPRPSTQCSSPLQASLRLARGIKSLQISRGNEMRSPVYLLVIRGGEQTSQGKKKNARGSAHAVYAPAAFHLPLMKLFVFMTSCHPGELNENVAPVFNPTCVPPPPPKV